MCEFMQEGAGKKEDDFQYKPQCNNLCIPLPAKGCFIIAILKL